MRIDPKLHNRDWMRVAELTSDVDSRGGRKWNPRLHLCEAVMAAEQQVAGKEI